MIEIELYVTKGKDPITVTCDIDLERAKNRVSFAIDVYGYDDPIGLLVTLDGGSRGVPRVSIGPDRKYSTIVVDYISKRVSCGRESRSFKKWIRKYS